MTHPQPAAFQGVFLDGEELEWVAKVVQLLNSCPKDMDVYAQGAITLFWSDVEIGRITTERVRRDRLGNQIGPRNSLHKPADQLGEPPRRPDTRTIHIGTNNDADGELQHEPPKYEGHPIVCSGCGKIVE
jgi:hypothetical protein